jgi:hypothetical protein
LVRQGFFGSYSRDGVDAWQIKDKKDLFAHLAAAKITQMSEFTPMLLDAIETLKNPIPAWLIFLAERKN